MAGTDDKSVVPPRDDEVSAHPDTPAPESPAENGDLDTNISYEQTTDASSSYSQPYYDDYGYEVPPAESAALTPAAPPPPPAPAVSSGGAQVPPPPASGDEEDEDDEEGMLRMSFLEHLEELRTRIIRALMGVGIAFAVAVYFSPDIWELVSAPAREALIQAGVKDGKLAMLEPTEAFSVLWVKLPILTAIFLASPWILWQVWAFIAPGLYKRERKWAAPFVISTAGLFILGGLFAYFVAFKLGLAFLIGIGSHSGINPVISLTNYLDLFINVSLMMGLAFELPIVIFFLSLLGIVTPGFLMRNSRYAILIIVVIAAILTPTPDVINLMLVALPMTFLYFGGIFAAYLLSLSRANKSFPWLILFGIVAGFLAIFAGGVWLAVAKYGYKLVPSYPFLIR